MLLWIENLILNNFAPNFFMNSKDFWYSTWSWEAYMFSSGLTLLSWIVDNSTKQIDNINKGKIMCFLCIGMRYHMFNYE